MGRFWQTRDIPGNPKISMVIAAYGDPDPLGCLLYALKCQTYKNWEALVIYDDEVIPDETKELVLGQLWDDRIKLWGRPHKGQYGHCHREYGIQQATGDYICLTNHDNYYVPVFFEAMLHTAVSKQADFVYCPFIHDYFDYAFYPSRCHGGAGGCDLANWIAKADVMKATPWTDYGFNGDETFINALLAKCRNPVHVAQPEVVVNNVVQPSWAWKSAYVVHN
jgi:glycosyltransferase involved in cell wall biosynthesis